MPPRFGGVPEWPKGSDCKSAGSAFDGSNPSPPTNMENIKTAIMAVFSFYIIKKSLYTKKPKYKAFLYA